MSTILKALRRLEQERQQVTPRALREEVVLSRSRARTRPTWIAALVAVALLGFAGTWAALGRWRVAPPEATGAAPAALRGELPVRPAARPQPSVAAPPPPAASTAPAAAAAAGVATAPSGPAAAPPPAPMAVELPAADRAPASAAAPDELFARPMPRHRPRLLVEEDEAPAPPPQSGSEPPFAVHDTQPAAPSSAAPGARPPFAVPDAEPATAPAVAAAAPFPLRVVRTSWHPHPDRRTAWVDLGGGAPRAVHEGDTVGRFVVREIEPDGVVFVDGSLEIRRAVGAR
jgi:hypothetical protein